MRVKNAALAIAGAICDGPSARVLFEYNVGSSVSGLGGTFARADATTCATYVDSTGLVKTVAANVLRDQHYINGQGPYILLEGSRQNLVVQSDDMRAASGWTNSGGGLTIAQAFSTCGVVSLSRVTGITAAGYIYRAVTFTGDGVKAVSGVVQFDGSAGTTVHGLYDSTAGAERGTVVITWAANGTATAAAGTFGTLLAFERLADVGGAPTYRFKLQTASVTAANTNSFLALWLNGTATSIRIGGMQAEDAAFPSSIISTTTGAVTRAADNLSFPFAPVPQAMTVYHDTIAVAAGSESRMMVGRDTLGGTMIAATSQGPTSGYNAWFYPNGSARILTPITSYAIGDRIEMCYSMAGTLTGATLRAAGAVNGVAGAEVTNTQVADYLSAFSNQYVSLSPNGGANGFNIVRSFKIAAGVQSLNTMRTL